jgi:hypothetical protein
MKLITYLLTICIYITTSRRKFRTGCNTHNESISEEDKKLIVTIHNEYRNQIALGTASVSMPYASNMIQMYWNEELALKAQDWANKCKGSHSRNRNNPKFKVGENIFTIETRGGRPMPEWKKALDAWWAQSSNFEGKSVDKFEIVGHPSGYFSQMIWANSYWVGCGFSVYKTVSNTDISMYVCHYGPKGNTLNKPIYIQSASAQCNCLTGLSCGNSMFKGLCCPSGFCEDNSLHYNGQPFAGTANK